MRMTESVWTPEEIAAYKLRSGMDLFYQQHGVGASPEQRAEFLAEYLKLTMTDHDALMRAAAERGHAYALSTMEGWRLTLDSSID